MPSEWIESYHQTNETEILDNNGVKIHDYISCEQGAGVEVDAEKHPVLAEKLGVSGLTVTPAVVQTIWGNPVGNGSVVPYNSNPTPITVDGLTEIGSIADTFATLFYSVSGGSNPKDGWTYMQGKTKVWRTNNGIDWEYYSAVYGQTILTKANDTALFCWKYNAHSQAYVNRGAGYVPIVIGDGTAIDANLIDSMDGALNIAVASVRNGNLMFTDDDWVTSTEISGATVFSEKIKLIPMITYCIIVDSLHNILGHVSLTGELTEVTSIALADAHEVDGKIVLALDGGRVGIYDPISLTTITSAQFTNYGDVVLGREAVGGHTSSFGFRVSNWTALTFVPDMPRVTGSPAPWKVIADAS